MKLVKISTETGETYFESDLVSPATIFGVIAEHQAEISLPVSRIRYFRASPIAIELYYNFNEDAIFMYLVLGSEDEIHSTLEAFADDPLYDKIYLQVAV